MLRTTGLEERIDRFWRLENIDRKNSTIEKKAYHAHFTRTVQRHENGKFVVHLPFKDEIAYLGNSYAIALKGFASIKRCLQVNNGLRIEHTKFIEVYLHLNHMEFIENANGDGSK